MTTHGSDRGALVDNITVRGFVGRFAAQPNQRGALDVLRVHGRRSAARHHRLRCAYRRRGVRPGGAVADPHRTGPGDGSALYAFTGNYEIARLHPAGTHTQSLVTPAVGALELARQQDHAWLYIDPAGPTCALSAAEIDFALRNPNNPALKEALARHAAGTTDRNAIAALLRGPVPLLLAAVDSCSGGVGMRTTAHPDGSTSVFAFTSAPKCRRSTPPTSSPP